LVCIHGTHIYISKINALKGRLQKNDWWSISLVLLLTYFVLLHDFCSGIVKCVKLAVAYIKLAI
jgi:hypothetical protein